jgi:hypothetical protein
MHTTTEAGHLPSCVEAGHCLTVWAQSPRVQVGVITLAFLGALSPIIGAFGGGLGSLATQTGESQMVQ